MVKSRADFQPADEFTGSEAGARCQRRYSIVEPWKCPILFLALAPEVGVSFLSLPYCCLSHRAPGVLVWRDCAHHSRHSTSSPPLPGSEELLPEGRGMAVAKCRVWCTSVLSLNAASEHGSGRVVYCYPGGIHQSWLRESRRQTWVTRGVLEAGGSCRVEGSGGKAKGPPKVGCQWGQPVHPPDLGGVESGCPCTLPLQG